MRGFSGIPLLLALATIGAAPTPKPGPAEKPTPAVKPKGHGHAVEGRVVSVAAHRSFVVRTETGEESTLVLTSATHLTGGAIAPGQLVAVRYLAREGKKVATSVRVESGQAVSPTATTLGSQ